MSPPPSPRPPAPATRPIHEALSANSTLADLLQRMQEAQARLAAVRPALPAALRPHVRTGVLDDTGWNLVVPNGAVAAKLRQCLPQIEQALADEGWKPTAVRVKVQSDRT